jgi:hypothetical protein
MLMGGLGLGCVMSAASQFADSPGVFAGIVEIAIAGLAWSERWRRCANACCAGIRSSGTRDGIAVPCIDRRGLYPPEIRRSDGGAISVTRSRTSLLLASGASRMTRASSRAVQA